VDGRNIALTHLSKKILEELGLRGQNTLSALAKRAAASHRDIGVSTLLNRYQCVHRRAARPIYGGTNTIFKLITNDLQAHRVRRKAVLRIGNTFTPIKKPIKWQLTQTPGL